MRGATINIATSATFVFFDAVAHATTAAATTPTATTLLLLLLPLLWLRAEATSYLNRLHSRVPTLKARLPVALRLCVSTRRLCLCPGVAENEVKEDGEGATALQHVLASTFREKALKWVSQVIVVLATAVASGYQK